MEHEIRTSLENVTTRLRAAIDLELDGLAAELMRAADTSREKARAELEATVAQRLAQARTELESEAAVREARARADAAREFTQREEQVRASALAEARDTLQRERAAEAVRQPAAVPGDGRLEAIERLLSSVRRLDAATSLRETLEVLVQSASLEASRVAILLIEGSTVRSFAHRGFADIPEAGPLAAGGIVEAAVRHGQPASTADPAALKAPGFAGLTGGHAGFAVPLRVGNRTVAVLYADDAAQDGGAAPAAWPEALELLARHASMHLENLTAIRAQQVFQMQQAAQVDQVNEIDHVQQVDHIEPVPHVEHVPPVAEVPKVLEEPKIAVAATGDADEEAARRYAKLLVSEIKLYNEATVRQGRERRDLRSRLRDEIEHAEQTYLSRIPETVAARRQYFEQELVQTLAGGDAAALGGAGSS